MQHNPCFEPAWKTLCSSLELAEHFSVVFVFCSDVRAKEELFESANSLMTGQLRPFHRPAVQQADALKEVLLRMAVNPLGQHVEPVTPLWLELDGHPDDGSWDLARLEFLGRLNERRAALETEHSSTVVLVFPLDWAKQVAEAAPDLWTIRQPSVYLDVPPIQLTKTANAGHTMISDFERSLLEGDGMTAGEAAMIHQIPGSTVAMAFAAGFNYRHSLAAIVEAEALGTTPPLMPGTAVEQAKTPEEQIKELVTTFETCASVTLEIGGPKTYRHLEGDEIDTLRDALVYASKAGQLSINDDPEITSSAAIAPVRLEDVFIARLRNAPSAYATTPVGRDLEAMQKLVRDVECCAEVKVNFDSPSKVVSVILNEQQHVALYEAMDKALEGLENEDSALLRDAAKKFVERVLQMYAGGDYDSLNTLEELMSVSIDKFCADEYHPVGQSKEEYLSQQAALHFEELINERRPKSLLLPTFNDVVLKFAKSKFDSLTNLARENGFNESSPSP